MLNLLMLLCWCYIAFHVKTQKKYFIYIIETRDLLYWTVVSEMIVISVLYSVYSCTLLLSFYTFYTCFRIKVIANLTAVVFLQLCFFEVG